MASASGSLCFGGQVRSVGGHDFAVTRVDTIGALESYPHLVEIATRLPESGYDNALEFARGSISSSTGSTGFVEQGRGLTSGDVASEPIGEYG